MLPSLTYEEAPVGIMAWMRQRTRWMKGWMTTFVVHNRDPRALCRDLGWPAFIGFELYLGSLILAPLLHTGFLIVLVEEIIRAGRVPLSGDIWLVILVLGYGASFATVVAGLRRIGQKRLLALQALLPIYWILHSIATIRAGFELMTRPHFWAKTTHGVTRFERSFGTADAPASRAAPRTSAGNGARPAQRSNETTKPSPDHPPLDGEPGGGRNF